MLLLLVLLVPLVCAQVYNVQFARQLTPAFVQSLEQILHYSCDHYSVIDNSLLLFLNATQMQALSAHTGPEIVAVNPLIAAQKISGQPPAESVNNTPAFYRLGGQPFERPPYASQPPPLRALRIVIHAGAPPQSHVALESAAMNAGASTVTPVDDLGCIVRIDGADHQVAMAAASLDAVCLVEWIQPVKLANLWSSHSVQSDLISQTNVAEALSCTNCAPLWAANVTGAGQLIAVSDTGLSAQTCMFYDSQHAVPTVTKRSCPGAQCIAADTGHRKVRLMWSGTGGNLIDGGGHGTAVMGVVAGSAAVPGSAATLDASDFAGAAPDARLVVIDIEGARIADLIVPEPYDSGLMQYAYDSGARIHVGSWGAITDRYTENDRQMDSFLWHHRTMVAIFAAGNEYSENSVLSPARAKNVIAVGATMNGAAAYSLYTSPVLGSSAYSNEWVAEFSSRGGIQSQSYMKPNFVAPGGQCVWTAYAGAPQRSCSSLDDQISCEAGTSFAAPTTGGAVALLRQYFIEHVGFEPRASLVHAVLAAGAQPTAGIFPQRTYASVVNRAQGPYGRHYVEGMGRVSLKLLRFDQSLRVLSNEHHSLAFAGQVRRFCVSSDTPIKSIVLAYTDYPGAQLVNDLDLRVYADGSDVPMQVNDLQTRDQWSPIERVATNVRRVRIEVHAVRIAFGQQDFSLLVHADSAVRVNGELPVSVGDVQYSEVSGQCNVCNGHFVHTQCNRCGNGVIDAGEQCDGDVCCSANCRRQTGGEECRQTIVDRSCFVRGRCSVDALCSVETQTLLSVIADSTSECVPAPPAPTQCLYSSLTIMSLLDQRLAEQLLDVVVDSMPLICCRSAYDIAAATMRSQPALMDTLHEQLTREVVAALVNMQRAAVSTSVERLQIVAAAQTALEAQCAGKEASIADHLTLLQSHTAANYVVCPPLAQQTTPNTQCASDAGDREQARANVDYCDGAGTFNFVTKQCVCPANRLDADCSTLRCSYNGLSTTGTCQCLLGWRGTECSQCESSQIQSGSRTLRYLCIGLDRRSLPLEMHAVVTHSLQLVDAQTVQARLNGQFYDARTLKAADRIPGVSDVDCACRAAQIRTFQSSSEAMSDALEWYEQREIAWAAAAPPARTQQNKIKPPTAGAGSVRGGYGMLAAAALIALVF